MFDVALGFGLGRTGDDKIGPVGTERVGVQWRFGKGLRGRRSASS